MGTPKDLEELCNSCSHNKVCKYYIGGEFSKISEKVNLLREQTKLSPLNIILRCKYYNLYKGFRVC